LGWLLLWFALGLLFAKNVELVANNLVGSPQLNFTLLLCFCNFGVACFDVNDCGFSLFSAKEISFLHQKVAASACFLAVMPLHCLIKGEAVFGDVAFLAACMVETSVGVAKTVGFVGVFLVSQRGFSFSGSKGVGEILTVC
jgi:hypothetical protein